MTIIKIAFFVPSFPNVSETFIVNQIIDLINKGYDVRIFALSRGPENVIHNKILKYDLLAKTRYPDDLSISFFRRYFLFFKFLKRSSKNINVGRLPRIFKSNKLDRKAFNLRYFTKYLWIFREGPYDLLHAHFGVAGNYVAEMKSFGYFSKAPLVTSFHGYDISPHLFSTYKSTYIQLFQESDLFTVNTPYTYSLLKQLTEKRIEILPEGVNTQEFISGGKKDSSKMNIIFVGRLVPFKAPGMAVQIVEQLLFKGHNQVQLNLVGEGLLLTELENYIKARGLNNNIKLMGALKQEEIRLLMENSHIFLLPGIYDEDGRAENQGLVIQEAQAMELPVVVSDAGGMKYGLVNGETGYVIKENDIEAYVSVVEELLINESKRKSMGIKGREYVIKNYDSAYLGSRLVKLYNDLLDKNLSKSF